MYRKRELRLFEDGPETNILVEVPVSTEVGPQKKKKEINERLGKLSCRKDLMLIQTMEICD